MSAFLLEEPYDEEGPGPGGNGVNPSATQPVRRFQWWGWLATIGGYISGNGYVWPFRAPAWRDHLDTQGSRDMARLNAFMRSIAWYNLVPSGLGGMRMLITAGGGLCDSPVNSSNYVAAAASPDGVLLIAYIPLAHAGEKDWVLVLLVATPSDFNADGRSDILWRNSTTVSNAIWRMNGAALLSRALIPAVPASWSVVNTH